MERLDTIKLIDFIVIHRPNFVVRMGDKIYKDTVNEWTRVAGEYDYEDVFNNTENFLKDPNNYGKDPSIYQLIRGLLTTKDKETNSKGRCACQFCGRWFNRLEVYDHEDRCRSVKYLKRVFEKWLKMDTNHLKELYDMSQEDFDRYYIKVITKASDRCTDILEYRGMINTIETYYGRPPKFTFNQVVGKEL